MRRPGWHTCASKAGEKGVRDIICGANARIARKTNDVGANVSFVRGRQTLSYRMPPIRFILTILMLRYLDLGTSWISGSRYEFGIPLSIYMILDILFISYWFFILGGLPSWTGLGRMASINTGIELLWARRGSNKKSIKHAKERDV